MTALFRSFAAQLLLTLLVAVAALCAYVGLGMLLTSQVSHYRHDIEAYLSQRLQQPVTIGSLKGSWHRFSPVIEIEQLALNSKAHEAKSGISIEKITAELDVSASLYHRQWVLANLATEGLRADTHQRKPKVWTLNNGWEFDFRATRDETSENLNARPPLIDWLELQQRIEIKDWRLESHYLDGVSQSLVIDELILEQPSTKIRRLEGYFSKGAGRLDQLRVWGQVEGEIWPWSNQNGDFYVRVDPQHWERLIPEFMSDNAQIKSLDAGVEAWLRVENGEIHSLLANAKINEFVFNYRDQSARLGSGMIRLTGQHVGSDWHIRLNPDFKQALPVDELRLSSMQFDQQRIWQVGVQRASVTDINALLVRLNILPAVATRFMGALNPIGTVRDLEMTWLPLGEEKDGGPDWFVSADLDDVSTKTYHGIPEFSDVSGHIQFNAQGGKFSLQHEEAELWIAGVYDRPWHLEDLTGDFYWKIYPNHAQLVLDKSSAILHDAGVSQPLTAEFSMRLPRKNEQGVAKIEPNMTVLVGLNQASHALHKALVPALAGTSLTTWLGQNIRAGTITQGQFVLNGRMNAKPPEGGRTLALNLDIRAGELSYQPNWPMVRNIDADLSMDLPHINIKVKRATTWGGRLGSPAHIHIGPDSHGQMHLGVDASVVGSTQSALRYLTQTPLSEHVEHVFDQWQTQGQHRSHLKLDLPLTQGPAVHVQLASTLMDTDVHLTAQNLSFTKLNGPLRFDSNNGLSIEGIKGETLGGEFELNGTTQTQGAEKALRLKAKGLVTWDALKNRFPLAAFRPISGEAIYQADVLLASPQAGGSVINLTSDLVGSTLDYPDMLKKARDEKAQLSSVLTLGSQTRLSFDFNHWLKGVFAFKQGELDRGQFLLGDGRPYLEASPGISIRGSIDQSLDAQAWWETWNVISAPQGSLDVIEMAQRNREQNNDSHVIRSVSLDLLNLHGFGQNTGRLSVNAEQRWDIWNVRLNSQMAKGEIILGRDQDSVINLDYLNLTTLPERQTDGAQRTQQDPLADVSPVGFGRLNVAIDEFYLDTHNLGRWQFETNPVPDGIRLSLTEGHIKDFSLDGRMTWSVIDGVHHTNIRNFRIKGEDIGQLQRELRMEPLLESKRLRFASSVSWKGSPLHFNPETLNGALNVRLDDGRFYTQNEDQGALKFLGAFNAGAIRRRLALDFSDLYQSGVSFDVLAGKASVKQGIMTLQEPLLFDGPGSKFLFSGTTNLTTHALDGQLVATFPVTGTLPLIAIAAGIAPPLAGAIFVTERLIGTQLERFSSAKYSVSGSWEVPELKIKNVFDNSLNP